jgi:hypothetical protein
MQQGILRDVERKATKGDSKAFNIDPLRGDREQLLEIIYDVSPIEHPTLYHTGFSHSGSGTSHATRT